MDATTFLMNCYGIQAEHRDEFESTLAKTSTKNIDFALRMMGQHPDDEDFDTVLEEWPMMVEAR